MLDGDRVTLIHISNGDGAVYVMNTQWRVSKVAIVGVNTIALYYRDEDGATIQSYQFKTETDMDTALNAIWIEYGVCV